jgi:Fe2+ transport system protein B
MPWMERLAVLGNGLSYLAFHGIHSILCSILSLKIRLFCRLHIFVFKLLVNLLKSSLAVALPPYSIPGMVNTLQSSWVCAVNFLYELWAKKG